MNKNKILQKDYTLSSLYYQIKLPLDLEILIPADDPVRLLSAFVEGMELSALYKTYGKIKKNQASPRQLFKIIIYASMNRIYSSRDIETACHRDINFMYLLEGKPVPDHATIARFISLHFSKCSKNTLAEVKIGRASCRERVFLSMEPNLNLLRINILLYGKDQSQKTVRNCLKRSQT